MESERLIAHPAFPPRVVSEVAARIVGFDACWLRLRWRIEGSALLLAPPFAGARRRDGLWHTTCFELFVASEEGSAGYTEFNFSPSEAWAAYDFAGYRGGMAERPLPRAPVCAWRPGSCFALIDVEIPRAGLPPLPWRYGLSAVIEEKGGVNSYWAMAHGGETPDFHDRACFAAKLAAPAAP